MKAETQGAMLFFSKALQRFVEGLAEDKSNPLVWMDRSNVLNWVRS